MKSAWKIAASVFCVVIIGGAVITWQVHERKLTEAARVCRISAEQGNTQAQHNLGDMYYYGRGVHRDYSLAVSWLQKAADQGNAGGQNSLGYMYEFGKGVPQDFSEAHRWYQKAADQGYAKAQFNIGDMYYYAFGVPQDNAEAVRWYRKAADQGYAKAQYDLGRMYNYGYGVSQDRAEAVRWYHKAADQGDEYAQRALGLKGPKWSTFSIINHSIIPIGCLILLIGSLSPGWRLQNRHQRAAAIAALLGLTTEGMSLYWVFVAFPSMSAVNAFYFGKSVLSGIFVVMLVSIVLSERDKLKRTKIALGITGILFFSLNLLLLIALYKKLFIPVRAFCSFNGLFIGASIPLAIFLWRPYNQSTEEQNSNSEEEVSDIPDESETEAHQE